MNGAHEDRQSNLSIAEGDDGRVLIHCHAGCTVDEICAALDLSAPDLVPSDGADVDTNTLFLGLRGICVNVNKVGAVDDIEGTDDPPTKAASINDNIDRGNMNTVLFHLVS